MLEGMHLLLMHMLHHNCRFIMTTSNEAYKLEL